MCDDFVIKNQQQKYKKEGEEQELFMYVYYSTIVRLMYYMQFLDPNTD